jgi:hypothetical protein
MQRFGETDVVVQFLAHEALALHQFINRLSQDVADCVDEAGRRFLVILKALLGNEGAQGGGVEIGEGVPLLEATTNVARFTKTGGALLLSFTFGCVGFLLFLGAAFVSLAMFGLAGALFGAAGLGRFFVKHLVFGVERVADIGHFFLVLMDT